LLHEDGIVPKISVNHVAGGHVAALRYTRRAEGGTQQKYEG